MKTSKYNTREASSVPKRLSLRDPFTGELIKDEDENTVDFYVYGTHSDVSRNAVKARDRKYGKAALTDEQAEQSGADYLAAITQGWSNNLNTLYDGVDEPIAYTKDAASELFKSEDWIAAQVLEFSRNLTNYDPKL